MLRVVVDDVQVAAIAPRKTLAAVAFGRGHDHLAEADDQVQGGAQLVAHVGHKLGLELLRLLRCLASDDQGGVGPLEAVVGLIQLFHQPRELRSVLARLLHVLLGLAKAEEGPLCHGHERPRGDPTQ